MLPSPAPEIPAPDGPAAPSAVQQLVHVLLAGGLGVLAAVVGAPVLAASLFGGAAAVLAALGGIVALVAAAAVALDRLAGPGGYGRPGSALRGAVLAVVSTAIVVVLAGVVVRLERAPDLPVLLWYAAAGLPFAAVAGLQWPGRVRTATAVLLVVSTAAVGFGWGRAVLQDVRAERIRTEVGTTERPWTSEPGGYRARLPQATGSALVWTRLSPVDGAGPQLWLFRDDPVDPAAADPCAVPSLRTPDGDQPVIACRSVRDGVWLRETDGWQELTRYGTDVRVGVAAPAAVAVPVLEEALAAARPMTGAEYESWLEEGLTPGW
ncbi:hypothetical protein E9529_12790 [Blastococcus sp. KM273128]|uniref:hypothetical protein n=1 Tax=Blastococcus sp. KM273128 TaxID=2570314 RepID=UPI001F1DC40B|nr:hypothetical protein [Blastococcus sp. KM273128]MCF6745135.1 hypothetical protein [Blastococcus sp. KM273128]